MDVVKNGMPSQTFDEMMTVLRKFVSFMNFTVSPDTLPARYGFRLHIVVPGETT